METSVQSNLQSAGDKWKKMNFDWARNSSGTEFWRGKFVSFSIRGQRVYGKIVRFLENLQVSLNKEKIIQNNYVFFIQPQKCCSFLNLKILCFGHIVADERLYFLKHMYGIVKI